MQSLSEFLGYKVKSQEKAYASFRPFSVAGTLFWSSPLYLCHFDLSIKTCLFNFHNGFL